MNRTTQRNISALLIALTLVVSAGAPSAANATPFKTLRLQIKCFLQDAKEHGLGNALHMWPNSAPQKVAANGNTISNGTTDNKADSKISSPILIKNPSEPNSQAHDPIANETAPSVAKAPSLGEPLPQTIEVRLNEREARASQFHQALQALQKTATPTLKRKNGSVSNPRYVKLKTDLRRLIHSELNYHSAILNRLLATSTTRGKTLSSEALKKLWQEIEKEKSIIKGLTSTLNNPMLDLNQAQKINVPSIIAKIRIVDYPIAYRLTHYGLLDTASKKIAPINNVSSEQIANFLDQKSILKTQTAEIAPLSIKDLQVVFTDSNLSIFKWVGLPQETLHIGICRGPCKTPERVITQTETIEALNSWVAKVHSKSLPHGYRLTTKDGLEVFTGKKTSLNHLTSQQLVLFLDQPLGFVVEHTSTFPKNSSTFKPKLSFIDSELNIYEWSDPSSKKMMLGYCKAPCSQPEKIVTNPQSVTAVKAWLMSKDSPSKTIEVEISRLSQSPENDEITSRLLAYHLSEIKVQELEAKAAFYHELYTALDKKASDSRSSSSPLSARSNNGTLSIFLDALRGFADYECSLASSQAKTAALQNASTAQNRLSSFRNVPSSLFDVNAAIGTTVSRKSLANAYLTPNDFNKIVKLVSDVYLKIGEGKAQTAGPLPNISAQSYDTAAQLYFEALNQLKSASDDQAGILPVAAIGPDKKLFINYIKELERHILDLRAQALANSRFLKQGLIH